VLENLIAEPARLAALSRGAIAHAAGFGWPVTADRLISVYTGAMNEAVVPVRA
jgi:D-inositol-3-phosphate glycosyltransferase